MTLKLYKAAEVCDLVQVQPYVLRSWEKEFPGIGVQKSHESQRLYRQSDLEQVRRIKQLVFDEGLTVAGVRRRLEESTPAITALSEAEVADVLDSLGASARARIAAVRDGLRQLRAILAADPLVHEGSPVVSLCGRGRAFHGAADDTLSLEFDAVEPHRQPPRRPTGKSVKPAAARAAGRGKVAAPAKKKRARA